MAVTNLKQTAVIQMLSIFLICGASSGCSEPEGIYPVLQHADSHYYTDVRNSTWEQIELMSALSAWAASNDSPTSHKIELLHTLGEKFQKLDADLLATFFYTQLIDLSPDNGHYYADLAVQFGPSGNTITTQSYFEKAVELEPTGFTYKAWADFYLMHEDYEKAFTTYETAFNLSSDDSIRAYSLIMMHIAANRANRDLQKTLARYSSMISDRRWPYPVVQFYQGEVDQDSIIDYLQTGDLYEDQSRLCEALYYVGQWHLMRGRSSVATQYFRKSVDTKVPSYRESTLAKHELRGFKPNP